jgi:hypothetical protein
LVEGLLAIQDKVAVSNDHRYHLDTMIHRHRAEALALDVEGMIGDAPAGLNSEIVDILKATQVWLRSAHPRTDDLYELYKNAEWRRKGIRARLPLTLNGRDKRAEWSVDPSPLAQPLHYRWNNVLRLLMDLGGSM